VDRDLLRKRVRRSVDSLLLSDSFLSSFPGVTFGVSILNSVEPIDTLSSNFPRALSVDANTPSNERSTNRDASDDLSPAASLSSSILSRATGSETVKHLSVQFDVQPVDSQSHGFRTASKLDRLQVDFQRTTKRQEAGQEERDAPLVVVAKPSRAALIIAKARAAADKASARLVQIQGQLHDWSRSHDHIFSQPR